jgi:hypothetical protein
MRRHVIAVLAAASVARAAPKPKLDEPPPSPTTATEQAKPIDLTPVRDKLDVYRDDTGNFVVSPRHDAIDNWEAAQGWVFYGDGKTMYRQRIISSSYNPDSGVSWGVWAPRAKSNGMAFLELGHLYIQCRQVMHANDKVGVKKLELLKADEAKQVLARAKFYPELWHREAHRLGRDDDGVYYYIGKLREEYGGHGFRVFVGSAGAMKLLAMTNVASDSAGEIFATKTGQLKIVLNDKGPEGTWIKGGKRAALTMVPIEDNRYLIYRDLGIYGALGTPCDDM